MSRVLLTFNANYSNLENYARGLPINKIAPTLCMLEIFTDNFVVSWASACTPSHALNILTVDSQLTKLHLHFASTKSWTFVRLVSAQLKINVGRRGTNQLHLLERYLDVLVKHTIEIPPPTALVEGTAPVCLSRRRIIKMIYFNL